MNRPVFWYRRGEALCASHIEGLPLAPAAPPAAERLLWLFEAPAERSRASFALTDPALFSAGPEGVHWLNRALLPPPQESDPFLAAMAAEGRVRAVNIAHPRWQQAAEGLGLPAKSRLHLLATGDVGGTLLTGLRLLGGDVLSGLGLYDLNENLSARWEMEIGQISRAWDYDSMPEARLITAEELFECDVFVFCASRSVPPIGAAGDVRMAQFEQNAAIVAHYARLARERRFRGLFAMVSDPVDLLCKVALVESNRGAFGDFDGQGLFPEQIQGYGLGVMNARAAYWAKRDKRFPSFLTEGRSFGPHGADLVIANSIDRYDDGLSKELTELVVGTNLQVRALGFKPYIAPALSSGALSLLDTLRGQWHCGASYLGGVYMGAKTRFAPAGLEVEMLTMPPALYRRIEEAAAHLAAVYESRG